MNVKRINQIAREEEAARDGWQPPPWLHTAIDHAILWEVGRATHHNGIYRTPYLNTLNL